MKNAKLLLETLLPSLRATLVLTALTGVLYPLAVLGAARLLFPGQARGSLRKDAEGTLVGSSLIGQPFSAREYFWGRPSAAGGGYDPRASCGSNVTPVSADTIARVQAERDRLVASNPAAQGPPPLLLVTTSGSGLDPDISPEAAQWQVPRVAGARAADPTGVASLVSSLAVGRTLGVLGEPRVNVLELNLALDERFPRAAGGVR